MLTPQTGKKLVAVVRLKSLFEAGKVKSALIVFRLADIPMSSCEGFAATS